MRTEGGGGGRECRTAVPVSSVCSPGLTLENALCLTPVLCFHYPEIVGNFVWDFFFKAGSLCCPCWPIAHYGAKGDLALGICLPLPLGCWDHSWEPSLVYKGGEGLQMF